MEQTGTMSRGRVLAAMSGGVDSSVSALILKREGWDVVGVTMDLSGTIDPPSEASPSTVAWEDARAVCDWIGIPHVRVDMGERFRKSVVDPFVREYGRGRTPNPCVLCNERIKFGALMGTADEIGAKTIATGHYAVIRRSASGCRLFASPESGKDQSYFLFSLDSNRLDRILFPVGTLGKREVRAIAAEAGLPVWDRPESQDICFIPSASRADFLESRGVVPEDGDFVDVSGNVLGRHQGISRYTVGQRKGLGLAGPAPYFVVRIDAGSNTIVLGSERDCLSGSASAGNISFVAGRPPAPEFRALARIRYRHPGILSTVRVHASGQGFDVAFDTPQRGVAPGQAVVLYDGDEVIGGGWIECASD